MALAGVALVAVALALGRAGLVGPALILLAAGYAARLAGLDPGLDGRTPLAAAELVAAGELAYLSIALRLPVAQAARARGADEPRSRSSRRSARRSSRRSCSPPPGSRPRAARAGTRSAWSRAAVALGLVALLARRRASEPLDSPPLGPFV